MTEELDETICPLCGKALNDGAAADWVEFGSIGTPESRSTENVLWAVAHYLAHLVQQQAPPPLDANMVRTMYLNNEWLRRTPSYELVDKKPRRRKNTPSTPSA